MNEGNRSPFLAQIQEGPVKMKARILQVGLLVLGLIALTLTLLLFFSIRDKRTELERSVEKRLEILADGRAEIVSTWLSGLAAQGDRIIQSDVFRLYAAEIDRIEGDVSVLLNPPPEFHRDRLGESSLAGLSEQLPMMVNLLKEFVSYGGFLSGRIVNRTGQAYIATDAATVSLSEEQKGLLRSVLESRKRRVGPLRFHAGGLVLDIYLPIFPPPGATDEPSRPVAVLMLSRLVTQRLDEILAGSPLAMEWEKTRLVQARGSVYEEILPGVPGRGLKRLERSAFNPHKGLPFGVRMDLEGKTRVYSVGRKVSGPDWWIILEADYSLATRPLRSFIRTTVTIAVLVLSALSLLLGAAWWKVVGKESRKIAEQIDSQHRFLESINSTVTDYIAYKDLDGVYRYVNRAFAKAVGREVDQCIGLDDQAVFGFDTARRLRSSDDLVLEKETSITVKEQIYLSSKPHQLLITKIPLKDSGGRITGIVSVFTDITPIVEAQEKRERMIRQTIDAFVKTVEMSDPYLAGHSRLMSILSKAVSKELKTDEKESLTVEFASLLSQIGKVFVDRTILTKPGVVTEEERQELRKHVEHAASILRDIDFDLPLLEAIYQMNEHEDGSGYPRGLKGEDIQLTAKILAVANRFCAMIRPRSYRSALSPQEALTILERETSKYSPEVVKALKHFVNSAEGDKLLGKMG